MNSYHATIMRPIYEPRYLWLIGMFRVFTTGTRIPDPPFSSFGPSRDYGMDLCLEVYL